MALPLLLAPPSALAEDVLASTSGAGGAPTDPIITGLFVLAILCLGIVTVGVAYLSFVQWRDTTEDRKNLSSFDSSVLRCDVIHHMFSAAYIGLIQMGLYRQLRPSVAGRSGMRHSLQLGARNPKSRRPSGHRARALAGDKTRIAGRSSNTEPACYQLRNNTTHLY